MRLVTFGAPRLEVCGGAEALRSHGPSKALALITFLAFAPRRTATRDTLCDLLWGDSTVGDTRAQLRQTFWLIKTEIHPELLAVSGETVAIAAPLVSDAEEFVEAIEADEIDRALTIYGGDFFSGYAAPGARRFEEWANVERTRLRSLFVHAAELRARRSLDSGRFADAITLAQRVRAIDAHSQTGWRLLLEARIASGDSLSARSTADQFEEWLEREEWEPEPASRSLIRIAKQAADRTDTTTKPSITGELVGRDREFAAIHDAWTTAKMKGAQFVHITGASGLGKTRLIRDIIARIRAGRERARYVRANFGERGIPFSFASAIAEVLGSVSGASGVAPAAARTLVSLNPKLSSLYSDSATAEPLEPLRVGLALLELIASVADEKPIAIALDDLHWSDTASRDAVAVVASRLDKENVLLITTSRPQYSAGSVRPATTEIDLTPLGDRDVTTFVTSIARLPEEEWADDFPCRLCDAGGGNPLRIIEAIDFCLDKGLLLRDQDEWQCPDPTALRAALDERESVDWRIAKSGSLDNSIVLLLAIAGMPVPRSLVIEAGGANVIDADQAADSLELRGLLVSGDHLWSLAHDSIAESLLDQSPEDDLRTAHARLGEAMAASDDALWRRRALPHLAQGERWEKLAASMIPFLRGNGTQLESVDSRIEMLLGFAASELNVTRVRGKLPVRLRHRRLLSNAAIAATGIVVLGGAMGIWRMQTTPRQSATMLAVVRERVDGKLELREANLDVDRWDARSPIRFASRHVFAPGPLRHPLHATARPGSRSWAIYSVYPDSGEGDIQLLERNGRRVRLTRARGDDRPFSFSPDGRQLLFLTTRWSSLGWSDLAILDMESLEIRRLTTDSAKHVDAYWSPDGSRIAFTREFDGRKEICVSGVDGARRTCRWLPERRVPQVVGWAADNLLLLRYDSADVPGTWANYDVERGTLSRVPLGNNDDVRLDGSGRWAIIGSTVGGQYHLAVAPSTRFELARRIAGGDPDSARLVWFVSPKLSETFIDSVGIAGPDQPLEPGIPHRLTALAKQKGGRQLVLPSVQWRSLTPDVASIDSLGVLIARTRGNAIIEASAGGWRIARDTMRIGSTGVPTLMDERWEDNPFSRWRPFGVPDPVIISESGIHAFMNNGDGMFFSGAYSKAAFDATHGVAMDFDLSTPITRTQWQVAIAVLATFTKPEALRRWDHKTGYINFAMSGSNDCSFSYPEGEGPAAVRPRWVSDLAAAMHDASYRIDRSRWFHVRLQLFPDGRCGIAINGHPLVINARKSPSKADVHALLQGSSVGTRILIGRVVVRSGVPADVDWTPLRFTGFAWEPVHDMHRIGKDLQDVAGHGR